MYVVKVGEYYVRKYHIDSLEICVILSKEIMTGFDKVEAEILADKINGEVQEVDCD